MALTSKNSKMLVGRIGACTLFLAMASLACGAQETGAATASIVDAATGTNAIASVGRSAPNAKMLHVTLGHSIFINTRMRLKRVYVADPGVVTSATLTPNQIVVTAMNPGISSLTLLDETGQAQSYVISSDIDLDGLRSAMAEQLKGYKIDVQGAGGRVTLAGTVPTQALADSAAKLASLYAKEVANALVVAPEHPKQVRLQVRILEVDRNKALQLGVNLFNPGGHTNWLAQTTTGQYTSAMQATTAAAGSTLTFSNPLNFMLYSAKLNLGATIEDLQTKQVLQILAEPTITTISGEKANFLAGGEFPVPIVQGTGSMGTAPVVTIQWRQFGVKVEFTPDVNPDGTVRLKVAPEVSSLDYTNAVTVNGFTIPALSTRRAETDVELRSNQSFAISGLLDQRTTDLMSKNPGAANIPILGYLFKSKNTNHSTTELVIIVTPTVVDPITEAAAPNEPNLPISPLDTKGFDDSLGRNLNPKPTPAPINPEHPPFGGPTPPPAPTAAAPEPAAALEATPGTADSAKPDGGKTEPAKTNRVPAAPATAAIASTEQSNKTRSAAGPVVEIMALSHESDADAMLAALRRQGYQPTVTRVQQDSLLHINVGPFSSQTDAETMRRQLLHDGYDAIIR